MLPDCRCFKSTAFNFSVIWNNILGLIPTRDNDNCDNIWKMKIRLRKLFYDYFPKFYYFMMTSSVTSAFFWQVVLSEFTIRQDLSLYVWCDLETVSILLTRNMSWLLLLWSKLWDYCISYRLVCNAADFYHSEYCFSHQLLKSEPLSLVKSVP